MIIHQPVLYYEGDELHVLRQVLSWMLCTLDEVSFSDKEEALDQVFDGDWSGLRRIIGSFERDVVTLSLQEAADFKSLLSIVLILKNKSFRSPEASGAAVLLRDLANAVYHQGNATHLGRQA